MLKKSAPARARRKEPRIRPVPAVSRALAILRLLDGAPAPMGVKSIADELGLVSSTCLHILRVLVAEELVNVDPASKRYELGAGMLALTRNLMGKATFASMSQPALVRLSRKHGVTALSVDTRGPKSMTVVGLARAPTPFSLHVEVGSRFPSMTSATGRCIAAFGAFSTAQLKDRFRSARWHRAPSFKQWLDEVEEVRRSRVALDRGNYIAGITVLAVPVFGAADTLLYTLVCIGVSDQMDSGRTAQLVHDMKQAAASISHLLVRG
ncbi:MAG: IclR family transcriptional regulator [Gammaproteobacteria bacterium]